MDTASVQRALEVVPSTEVDLRWAGQRLTITPRARLLPDQAYTVSLGSGAHDQAGTALTEPLRLEFTTLPAGLSARTVVPAQGTQGIKNALLAGVVSIEHGIYLTDEIIDLMLQKDAWLVPTLVAPQAVAKFSVAHPDILPPIMAAKSLSVIEALLGIPSSPSLRSPQLHQLETAPGLEIHFVLSLFIF